MRWMLRIAAVLVALGVVVWLIGTRLPSGHEATVQRVIAASPDAVWETMTDVEAFPQWRPGVERVERLPPRNGLPAWREVGSGGDLTLSVVFLEPAERMVARVDDAEGNFGGTWTYQVSPAGAGDTAVTITEDGEIYDPFFRFVARFLIGYEGTMESYLDALAARVEGAEP